MISTFLNCFLNSSVSYNNKLLYKIAYTTILTAAIMIMVLKSQSRMRPHYHGPYHAVNQLLWIISLKYVILHYGIYWYLLACLYPSNKTKGDPCFNGKQLRPFRGILINTVIWENHDTYTLSCLCILLAAVVCYAWVSLIFPHPVYVSPLL